MLDSGIQGCATLISNHDLAFTAAKIKTANAKVQRHYSSGVRFSFRRLVVMSAKLSTSFVRRYVVDIMKRTVVNQISQIVPQSPVALYFLSLAQVYFRYDEWISRETIRVEFDQIESNRQYFQHTLKAQLRYIF